MTDKPAADITKRVTAMQIPRRTRQGVQMIRRGAEQSWQSSASWTKAQLQAHKQRRAKAKANRAAQKALTEALSKPATEKEATTAATPSPEQAQSHATDAQDTTTTTNARTANEDTANTAPIASSEALSESPSPAPRRKRWSLPLFGSEDSHSAESNSADSPSTTDRASKSAKSAKSAKQSTERTTAQSTESTADSSAMRRFLSRLSMRETGESSVREASWVSMRENLLIVTTAIAVVFALALSFYAGRNVGEQLTRADMEAVTRDYILANPDIVPQAIERYQAKLISERIAIFRSDLETPFSGAWVGNARADVTVVVFTDYACTFCRESLPDIERLTRENRDVKVVFRELPILSPYSRDAALAALRAARQGKYFAFHRAMFASGSPNQDTIAVALRRAGVGADTSADITLSQQRLEEEIRKNMSLAQQFALDGTPSWIIGDRLYQGAIGYAVLKQAVEEAKAS